MLVSATVILSSCRTDDPNPEYHSAVISVSHAGTVVVNEPLLVTLTHQGSSGCATYSRHEVTPKGSRTTQVEVFQFVPNDQFCNASLTEIVTEIEITFANEGLNTVEYLAHDQVVIDSVQVTN